MIEMIDDEDCYICIYIVMSMDYVRGSEFKDVWASTLRCVMGVSSETFELRRCCLGRGAETFVFDAMLDGVQKQTVLATLRIYVYIFMRKFVV